MLKSLIKVGKNIIGILCFGLIISFILFRLMQPASPFHLFGIQSFTVFSNSMEPTFQTGDIVIIRDTDPDDIQVGDVVTFRQSENKYITHRVNKISQYQGNMLFTTKGDANNTTDEEQVPTSSIMGKKLFHIPYIGYVATFISSKTGAFLFIFMPLLIYGWITVFQYTANKHKKVPSKIKGRNYS